MKHILVIGAGSIGKRHLRNCYNSLGCKVSAVDPRQDRLAEAAEQVKLENAYKDLAAIPLPIQDIDGVVIATPPKFHYEQCLFAIENELPIFLEKPGTKYAQESELLQQHPKFDNNKLLLGYCYRWWPSIQRLKEILDNSHKWVGNPLSANMIITANLLDWHPWEPYKDFFLANKELGGGALLDENHFVDLMIWFWGMPQAIFAKLDTLGDFDIDVEDNCEMIFRYDGFRVAMHLDMLARPHEKSIIVRGSKGSLRWNTTNDYSINDILYSKSIQNVWKKEPFVFDRNDMFISEAKEFLAIIDGKVQPSCTLQDGINVLKLVEGCKRSSRMRMEINV